MTKISTLLAVMFFSWSVFASGTEAISEDVYSFLQEMQSSGSGYIFEREGGTAGLLDDLDSCLSVCRTGPSPEGLSLHSLMGQCMASRGWRKVYVSSNK